MIELKLREAANKIGEAAEIHSDLGLALSLGYRCPEL